MSFRKISYHCAYSPPFELCQHATHGTNQET
jgi:hypothetical protein